MRKKRLWGIPLLVMTSLIISSCVELGETPDKPWLGYSKNKRTGKLEWWFDSHKTYDECIESMEWGVTNTVTKTWYEHPVGCGFMSNNYMETMFMNIFVSGTDNFECLVESKNPEIRKMNMKYGPVLKGFPNDCVDSSKQSVIY